MMMIEVLKSKPSLRNGDRSEPELHGQHYD